MPINIYVDTARKMIVETLVGTVTADEILEAWNKVHDENNFDPKYWQYSDFTQVTKLDVSAEFFRNFSRSKPLFDKSSRRALVAPSDAVFGMLRLYLTYLDDRSGDIRVFRDAAKARRWLGLEENAD